MTTLRSQKGMIAAGVVAFVAVLALGWFFLVSPKRNDANDLATQVTSAQEELAQKRAELARPSAAVRVSSIRTRPAAPAPLN